MTWHPDMPAEYRDAIVTGDARELAKRIPDESVDLIFTDPVYDRIEDYRWLAETAARVLKPGSALLTFVGIKELPEAIEALKIPALPWRGMICWNLLGPGNKRYGKAIDNGAWLLWLGGWPENYMPLLWNSMPANDRAFHWQKSPILTARHIEDFTSASTCVLDPFTGGGTVPAVCKMLGRHYIAFEIDPTTAERARQRVAQTQPPLPGLVVEQMAFEEVTA